MSVLVEIHRKIAGQVPDNEFGFGVQTKFEKVGLISVPIVDWKIKKVEDKHDVEITKGEIFTTRSKILSVNLTKDDRLKIEDEFYEIKEILPSGVAYTIMFDKINATDSTVSYEEA